MSVAERLEALGPDLDAVLDELIAWINTDNVGCIEVEQRGEQMRLRFRNALPQIVAVVGELGFAISDLQTLLDSDALTKTGRKKLENHIRCHRAALAALDEALGDVT